MKKLITLLAGVVVMVSMAGSVFAQAAGPTGGGVQTGGAQVPGQKARPPIGAKILKELNLTPDQRKQVKALAEKFMQKRQEELKATGKPNRKEMAQNRKGFMDDLSKILNPQQQDKLKQLMEQAKAKRGAKGIPPATGTVKTGGGL